MLKKVMMVMMVWRIHCRDNDAKDGNDGVRNSL